jgi:acyl-CoA hydrolase
MAIQYLSSINLTTNQLQYAVIQPATTDPTLYTPAEGQVYYNSVNKKLKLYTGTISGWVDVGAGVTSFAATDGTFINLTPNTTQTGAATLIADLSATGTPDNTKYLRGDNTWSPVSGISGTTYDLDTIQVASNVAIVLVGSDSTTDTVTLVAGTNITLTDDGAANITIDAANPDQTVTLTGEVTGTGTTSISTTVSDGVLDVANFNAAAIVTAVEGIENNNNDTTLPTSAAVKAYVDAAVVGGLIYQGGYDAATNTPNLDSPPTIAGIKKGWTYTVTVDGTFFTEQVRVGDVLIAEIDSPTTLADWTTVQNNIDIASLTQIGIGNVNAGTGIAVSYSNGTATVSAQTSSYVTTISATSTITHSLNTRDVNVQLYDTVTFETIFSDVARPSVDTVTITFATAPTNPIRVLVTKVG